MLSDNLSGLRWDPIRKANRELHDEVTPLRRVLRKRKAFASEPLHHSRLDDVKAGERDDPVFQRGNTNGAATESLDRGKTHRGLTSFQHKKCQSH